MRTILLTGGTGMIGTYLQKFLADKGYTVIVLIRKAADKKQSSPNIIYKYWDVENDEMDDEAIIQSEYIIHLAGANVAGKRWTKKRKNEIVESRTKSSALLIKKIKEIPNKIKAVISASAIGWYGPDTDKSKERGFVETEPAYNDFLGNTCKLWEASILPVEQVYKRLCIFRFGIVLGKDGGALEEFKKSLKVGIAGIIGDGKQIISWVHIKDLCRMLLFGIENENMQGVYNAVAPQTVTNKELTLTLAKTIRGKLFVPVHAPAFALKLMLGEMSSEVLKSTTANDEKIRKEGFDFLYPSINSAIKNLFD